MATIHPLQPVRKGATVHYAYLGDLYGTAEFLNGSGYLFRKDGEKRALLVLYNDPRLVLLGRKDLADDQRVLDAMDWLQS